MTTRRQFLSTVAASTAVLSTGSLGAPLFVPASALGREGKAAPSERIRLGVIGTGGRGRALINLFLGEKDTEIVAICDVDERHRKLGREAVQKKGGKAECAAYND